MNVTKSPIISAEDLRGLMGKPNQIIIDSSYPNGLEVFEKEHISGAQFVDLDSDLAAIKEDFALGGRHPLPKVADFIRLLNQLGISNDSNVIIYDRNSGAFASRMWWMMRSIGHVKVQVLDGGFAQAKAAGLPMESGKSISVPVSNYKGTNWNWPTKNMDGIESALVSMEQMVIDVRGEARYRGEVEPIDIIAGHIPGAINAPFANNLTPEGKYKSKEELKNKFVTILGNVNSKNVTFHCGSGVTACHSILAMDIAGLEIPALYVGSWSEWSRNNKPMKTND